MIDWWDPQKQTSKVAGKVSIFWQEHTVLRLLWYLFLLLLLFLFADTPQRGFRYWGL